MTLKQSRKLITHQNNKAEKIANGYIPLPKGRPRKNPKEMAADGLALHSDCGLNTPRKHILT